MLDYEAERQRDRSGGKWTKAFLAGGASHEVQPGDHFMMTVFKAFTVVINYFEVFLKLSLWRQTISKTAFW